MFGEVVGGFGLSYYPNCPHCYEYAYQKVKTKDGNYKCMFCGGIQKPIDWNNRPQDDLLEPYELLKEQENELWEEK